MKSEVMKRKNLWQTYSEVQLEKLEKTNALYRVCLDEGKTERRTISVFAYHSPVSRWMKEKQNGSVYRKPSNLPELRDTKI